MVAAIRTLANIVRFRTASPPAPETTGPDIAQTFADVMARRTPPPFEPERPTRGSRRTVLTACAAGVLLAAAAVTLYLTRPGIEPASARVLTNDSSPVVVFEVTNPAGLEVDEVAARVDGRDLPTDRIRVRRDGARVEVRPANLGEGVHEVEVRVGPLGLLRLSPETSARVVVDTTAPTLAIVGPKPKRASSDPYVPAGVVALRSRRATVTVDAEPGTTIRVESSTPGVDPVEAAPADARRRTVDVTLADGRQAMRIVAIDAAGNERIRSIDALVDTVGPAVSLRVPRVVKDAALSLPLATKDPHGVELRATLNGREIDPAAFGGDTDETTELLPTSLDTTLVLEDEPALEGRNVLEVVATDSLGHASKTKRTFQVDSGDSLAEVRGLRLGATGGDVAQLQAALVEAEVVTRATLGREVASKRFGPATRKAVSVYQSRKGMDADGVAGSDTIAGLTLRIVVDRGSHTLTLYRSGVVEKTYTVAVGSPKYPTPSGSFSIQSMQQNPTWTPPDSEWAKDAEVIPPGPDNPLGTRWMAVAGTVGIHGTNSPESLGYSVSHGCIRMAIPDVEDLYDRVAVGTPVEIV